MALVRVKLPNGDEATVGSDYADDLGLKVLDKDAVDIYGTPLPAKPFRALGETAGTTSAAPAADTTKEK